MYTLTNHGGMGVDASKLRYNLREHLDQVERNGVVIPVERWGRRVAVLVPAEWYERALAALGEPEQDGN